MMAKAPDFTTVMQMSPNDCLAMLEEERWPKGQQVCPKCGSVRQHYRIERRSKTKNVRSYYWKCKDCLKQFSVTNGTIFEGSHIPLNKWFAAIFLMCASKKGVSSLQLKRMLHIGYEAALFLTHRIRHAMANGQFEPLTGTVEADATYIGGKTRRGHPVEHERIRDEIEMGIRRKDGTFVNGKNSKGRPHPRTLKQGVFGMMERGGRVRTQVIQQKDETSRELVPLMLSNISLSDTRLVTDGHRAYRTIKAHVKHDVIDHSLAYVEGDVHTNNIEGYWSLLKRGLHGTFHTVSRHRLPHYLDEFAFRWNSRHASDEERFENLLRQTDGRVRWYFQNGEGEQAPE